MPIHNDLRSRLAAVSAGLDVTTRHEKDQLLKLEKLLVRSRIDGPAELTPRELSIERGSFFSSGNLPSDRRVRLNRLIDDMPASEKPQFRVFRRETPVSAPMLDFAVPTWGRGALAAHTIGPLRSVDGRLFWFDFFPIVRLIPLFFAGDALPAMLFFERTYLLSLNKITAQRSIMKSSLWIRANLLATGSPVGGYVGLRIDGGKLEFSVKPVNIGGRLTMPPGSTCKVALEVSPSDPSPSAPGESGRDAAKAVVNTPASFSFEL